MNIVHICMTQYSDGWTYQENLLAKYHRKLGHNVYVITSMYCYKEGELVKDRNNRFIDVNGILVIRLENKNNNFFSKIPIYNNFIETLCSLKPDIIFSHGCQYRDSKKIVDYVKKHLNVKMFVDNHADYSNSATNFISKNILHKIIWRYYAQKMIPYTETFWGVLPARVDFLIDVYKIPKEKCKLLVMGADDDLVIFSAAQENMNTIKKKYSIKKDDFLVVTGGKIDAAKRQTILLIKAILYIQNPKIKLIIFGSISEDIKYEVMQLVDNERIIYAGWISPDESYNFFAASDLVVFPGRHSVFWEQAAGQGKPLICKSWPGTHHIDVGGNVIFLHDDSVDEIFRIIKDITDNKNRYSNMKKSAMAKAMKIFSYMEIAKKSIGG